VRVCANEVQQPEALELALPVSKAYNIPINYHGLVRIRNTAQQSLLGEVQRKANVTGAFALTQQIPVPHIGLIDDVITSGCTVEACCRLLKATGVQKITVLAIAKATKNLDLPNL
jgi:predicted amidophosphoribosyltransferase